MNNPAGDNNTGGASGGAASDGAASALMALAGTVKQKWDASGANEALLSGVSDALPQGTKDYFVATSQQLFNRQHIRPLSVVFGYDDDRPFYWEPTQSLLEERSRRNCSYFYMNYIMTIAILFGLSLVTTVLSILLLAVVGFGWVIVLRASHRNGPVQIAKFQLPAKPAIMGMKVLSGIVLLYILLNEFSWGLLLDEIFVIAVLAVAWIYVMRAAQNGQLSIGGQHIPQKQASIGMGIVTALVLLYMLSNAFWWTLLWSVLFIGSHIVLRDAFIMQDHQSEIPDDLTLELITDTAAEGNDGDDDNDDVEQNVVATTTPLESTGSNDSSNNNKMEVGKNNKNTSSKDNLVIQAEKRD